MYAEERYSAFSRSARRASSRAKSGSTCGGGEGGGDGGGSDAGAVALAEHLRSLPSDGRRRTLLLGMSADKDARAVVVSLAPLVDRVLTTHCAHPRAASAGDLAALLVGVSVPVLPAGPVEQALELARAGDGLVIAAGSVFLAGAVRDLVGAR